MIRPRLKQGRSIDVVTPDLSIFALREIFADDRRAPACRLVVPADLDGHRLIGSVADRSARNRLKVRWLATQLYAWVNEQVAIRPASSGVPQGALVIRERSHEPVQAVLGAVALTTDGLGLTPGNPLGVVQASETPAEALMLGEWFDTLWATLPETPCAKARLLELLESLSRHHEPYFVYTLVLHHLFAARGDELDEEQVIKSATGIRNTVVWKKLFKFQRDGVIGAIDKLNRFGGCIIADSVGLGKTFEALAIIKYHELRNDRVLVLCPKRLRDNWTLYKANDRRNILASDRLNYDVLNHTDLSRDGGVSGDIDLANVNWGNYDLVVIDESHNFRNKKTPQAGG